GTFTAFSGSSFDDGTVAFIGFGASQQEGIYAALAHGSVIRIADRNTPIPGRSSNLFSGVPSLEGGIVAFSSGGFEDDGIYAAALAGALSRIADRNTPIPAGME